MKHHLPQQHQQKDTRRVCVYELLPGLVPECPNIVSCPGLLISDGHWRYFNVLVAPRTTHISKWWWRTSGAEEEKKETGKQLITSLVGQDKKTSAHHPQHTFAAASHSFLLSVVDAVFVDNVNITIPKDILMTASTLFVVAGVHREGWGAGTLCEWGR